jgi:hypothetical protein
LADFVKENVGLKAVSPIDAVKSGDIVIVAVGWSA